ncbi:hypothetical protein AB9K41_04360 [Cribrihabitans sp. XS_ASV171]
MSTICMRLGSAPLVPVLHALARILRDAVSRLPVRDMIFAAVIVLGAAAIVHADEPLQDWIPDVLAFPEDAEIVADRSIGSSVRMFSISTGENAQELLSTWEESLNVNGYRVTRSEGELLDQSIEFSGPGIANAKIIVAPTTEEGQTLIEFDATLE